MPRFLFARMSIRTVSWALALAFVAGTHGPAMAQQRPATNRSLPDDEEEPAPNNKLTRPAGEALRVDKPSAELWELLKKWEVASAKIKRLEGEHRRWEYDYTFNVEKRNAGVFYYESPDKGRIDLKAFPSDSKKTELKAHWKNGEQVEFKIQDGSFEKWYCDGQIVTQIDESAKTATRLIIPPQSQGEHITEGPLPFLFGMPAEKAIRRFRMSLDKVENNKATLTAWPLRRTDAANYQLATILLDLNTYLPDAVRLIDPAGTKETVFKFLKLKPNSKSIAEFFGNDPFKPNLRNLKIVDKAPMEERVDQLDRDGQRTPNTSGNKIIQVQGTRPASKPSIDKPTEEPAAPPRKLNVNGKAQPVVPSVIGLDHKKAKQILEQLGYEVKLLNGSVADREDFIHRVERQEPDPRTNLPEGSTIKMWIYLKPKAADSK